MPATSRRARRGWRRGCAASRGHGAWRQPHRRPASTVAASSFRLRPRATLAHDQPAEEADRPGDKRQQQKGELHRAAETLLIGVARDPHAGEQVEGEIVDPRSEEHTSELQSLMRISYAVFCLKKKKRNREPTS